MDAGRNFLVSGHLSGRLEMVKEGELRSEVRALHPRTGGLLRSVPSHAFLPTTEGSCLVPRRSEGVRIVEGWRGFLPSEGFGLGTPGR